MGVAPPWQAGAPPCKALRIQSLTGLGAARSACPATPTRCRVARLAPERMVCASDRPHQTEKEKPNDAVLFDPLAEWTRDPATRTATFVQNPGNPLRFSAIHVMGRSEQSP